LISNPEARMKISAAITLKEELVSSEDLSDKVSFNILLDPTDKEDKVKMSIARFGSGTPEEWVKFLQNLNKVISANNWNSKAAQQHSAIKLILKGEVEALYSRLIVTATPTGDSIKDALQAMTKQYLPIDCAKNTVR